ncbi:MAG: phosphoribosylamine--glycine ligase [Candidatus Altiarchaeota archaeon]|nr:phosphoribosylamine--glycine ligase [Candidatus Altiarchaeota archaeon]
MKVLVVGNGAREHAIATALSRSSDKPDLYAFMSAVNPGIARLVKNYGIGNICSPEQVVKYAVENGIHLAVVGPEAPLEAGVVDSLEENRIPCVGPRRKPAQIETDKSFCRNLMRKNKVKGCPKFGIFEDVKDACDYIDKIGVDIVIKPAGLTGGKGVKVMGEHFDKKGAKGYVKEVLDTRMGVIPKVILEERLIGEEFTLQAFVDGRNVVGMPAVQDHKRAYEGDVGPNTGGMGSYSDAGYLLPFISKKDYDDGLSIMKETITVIKKETGEEYKGFLYGQFMATKDGVKVIEFNARLGDPEAMNVLSLLESDMTDVCRKIAAGSLDDKVKFSGKATVCKYMVPEGYPDKPLNNVEVNVDEKKINALGGQVYYASVREENGRILTSKSRAIAVLGLSGTISEAEKVVEESMKHISGKLFYRKDIGTKKLIEKRIKHMKQIRGK